MGMNGQAVIWLNEKRKVEGLKDHPQNPRRFTDAGMKALRNSIEKCGYVEPIAINTDGTILSGHARKQILIDLGLDVVDVRVPNRPLTEEEQREVLIRMNKNTAGEFDFEILANEFEIEDLKEFGFTDYDLKITEPFDANSFFEKKSEDELAAMGKIVLAYTEEDCAKVKGALLKHAGTPEQAVWKLLGL